MEQHYHQSWFAETVMNGSSIAATAEYGQYLQLVSETIENANELMIDTVMTNKYEFSQCKNLDGFIAEQYHVNMFNMKAAIEKSNIRARVLKPLPGEKYGKNSVDIVLENIKTGKRVHQYQRRVFQQYDVPQGNRARIFLLCAQRCW